MTNSKLSAWELSPNLFVKQYEDIFDVDQQEKSYFRVGSMAEDYITWIGKYGHDEGQKKFLEKYQLGDGYQKGDLADMILMRDDKEYPGLDDVLKKKERGRLIRKNSLDELRIMYHGLDVRENEKKKIKCTPGEMETLIGIVTELKRQPLSDFGKDYETQVVIIGEYKGSRGQYNAKMKCTIDRLRIEDKDGNIIRLWDDEKKIWDYSKVKNLSDGEKKSLTIYLRDRKTTAKIDKFKRQIHDGLNYSRQMSFYYINLLITLGLTKVRDSIKTYVVLDAVSKIKYYGYEPHIIDKSRLFAIANASIVPLMNEYGHYINTGEKPQRIITEFERESLYTNPYYQHIDDTIVEEFYNLG